MRQALVQRDGITGDVSRSGGGSFFFLSLSVSLFIPICLWFRW